MPINCVYDNNCRLPNMAFFEDYYDLDKGYIRVASANRVRTYIQKGVVPPKGFVGNLYDWAKSTVMKEVYHVNDHVCISWPELIALSDEYEVTI